MRHHTDRLLAKKEQIAPTVRLTEFEKRSMDLQERTLTLQELSLKQNQSVNAAQINEKQTEAGLMADMEQNSFLGEVSVLDDIMPDENWVEVEEETVSSAMRNLVKWQDQMNVIERAYRKYDNMALKYNFPSDKKDAMLDIYEEKKK